MVPTAGLEPATSRLRSACTAVVLGRRITILAETRAVGRSYGSRGALMQRERGHVHSLRAEDPLEVGVRARDDVARAVGIRDDGVAGEQAPLRAQPLRRHDDAAGALDQLVWGLVWGLGTADHLVLLPVW